jgi:Tfp pilus assembly protein PilF
LDEAEAVYKKILGRQPKNNEALIAMAALCYTKNKTAEAAAYIATAVNTGSLTRNEYAQLGFSLLVANKNKEAATYYKKALAIEPRSFDYYNLACAYAKINEKGKAFVALEQSLKYGYGSKQKLKAILILIP